MIDIYSHFEIRLLKLILNIYDYQYRYQGIE